MQQALDSAHLAQNQQQECLLDDYMYTRGCPPVDLLVRTSGEQRLSDFMLRQSNHALLVFTGVLWPDFGFLDLVSAIIQYQKKYKTLQSARHAGEASISQLLHQRQETRQERKQQQERSATTPRLAEQLMSLKLPVAGHDRRALELDSPCSVATPGSGSSPSSRSPSSRSEGSNQSTEVCTLLAFEKEENNGTGATALLGAADVSTAIDHSGSVRRRIVS
jgi:hypothetical protein